MRAFALNGLTCRAVRNMNGEQIDAFTADQLRYVSGAAAVCVTREHVERLATQPRKRYSLWRAGASTGGQTSTAEQAHPPMDTSKLQSTLLTVIPLMNSISHWFNSQQQQQ
jgi:hypothetical protein